MSARLILVMAAWLGTAAAASGSSADEAEFHFRRGVAAQKKGLYEQALVEFYASNRAAPNRTVQNNIAACLGMLGRYEEAYRAYAELAESPVSEADRRSLDQSLEGLRGKLALVRVETDPPGASVFLDREELGGVGQTPRTLAVSPGAHRLLLRLEGHRPADLEVTASAGKEQRVAKALEPIWASVSFPKLPAGTEVRREEDGALLRTGPGEVQVRPGRAAFTVRAPGFLSQRVETQAVGDGAVQLEVPLFPKPPATGTLLVEANVRGARVFVDGVEAGYTPLRVDNAAVGAHRVEVTAHRREPASREVAVAAREVATVQVKLAPERPRVEGASRRLTDVSDAPTSVSIVTADELRALGCRTVAEGLRAVRGLYGFFDGAHQVVGARGLALPDLAASRVRVLLNGQPINEPISERAPLGDELGVDLGQVERIEVIRGAGMVMSASALLAVINVVTRRPDEGLHAGARLEASSSEGALFRAFGSARRGEYEALVTANLAGPEGAAQAASDAARMSSAQVVARAKDFSLLAGWSRRALRLTPAPLRQGAPRASLDEERTFAALMLDRPLGGSGRLFARLSAEAAGSVETLEEPHLQDRRSARVGAAEVWTELQLKPGHRLTLGTQLQAVFGLDQVLSDGSGEVERVTPSFDLAAHGYLGYAWQASALWALHLGARVESISLQRLDDPSYRLGSGVPLLALVGTPYKGGGTKLLVQIPLRKPSLAERFLVDPKGAPGLGPDTTSEARGAVELEHTHAFSDELSAVASAYVARAGRVLNGEREADFLLRESRVWATTSGVELEARYDSGAGMLVSATYAFSHSVPNPGQRPLENAPRHLLGSRVLVPLADEWARLAVQGSLAAGRVDRESRPLADTFLLDATVSGEYAPWKLQYQVGVFNLLDDRGPVAASWRYPEATLPEAGRRFRVSLGKSF